jgi:DNA-binding response OmpR family regulator
MTVMVVDDDPDIGDCAAELLAVAGLATLVARDGEQALGLALRYHVDVVLLDWNLPGIAGVALVEALRQLTRAPIVVCSADPASLDEALAAAPSALLAKPFSYAALVDAIRGTIAGHARAPAMDHRLAHLLRNRPGV